ncbi:hypothetical protein GBA52_006246 [Prunus armeniaca]|nr:hypothetical protein GBA52_006246 [Prunus armeniaca]
MAYAGMKPSKAGLEEPQEQIHKIRITLSSKNVKNLEKDPRRNSAADCVLLMNLTTLPKFFKK